MAEPTEEEIDRADEVLRAEVRAALEKRFAVDEYSGVLTHFVLIYARSGYMGESESNGTGFYAGSADMPFWMTRGLLIEGQELHAELLAQMREADE